MHVVVQRCFPRFLLQTSAMLTWFWVVLPGVCHRLLKLVPLISGAALSTDSKRESKRETAGGGTGRVREAPCPTVPRILLCLFPALFVSCLTNSWCFFCRRWHVLGSCREDSGWISASYILNMSALGLPSGFLGAGSLTDRSGSPNLRVPRGFRAYGSRV